VGKLIDEIGNRYGRLTVVKQAGSDTHGHVKWLCQCDCGKEPVVRGSHLRNGTAQSCGCFQKDRVRELLSLPRGEAAFNATLYGIKQGAKRRGFAWDLTREQARTLMGQNCHYCGTEPKQVRMRIYNTGVCLYNGLDRKDCSLGYTIDNVVPCCGPCNYAKRSMNVEEFRDWIVRVYKHFVKGEMICNG